MYTLHTFYTSFLMLLYSKNSFSTNFSVFSCYFFVFLCIILLFIRIVCVLCQFSAFCVNFRCFVLHLCTLILFSYAHWHFYLFLRFHWPPDSKWLKMTHFMTYHFALNYMNLWTANMNLWTNELWTSLMNSHVRQCAPLCSRLFF